MRVENHANRNNSNVFQKKDNQKKEEKKQESPSRNHDHLDLSSGIVLLTHLLDAPEHQYKPLPFYFFDAATKNAQLVANISKSIQQKARLQYIDLNYDMISDLVISHASETAGKPLNNPYQNAAFQHVPLQKNETRFFEQFHNKGIAHKLSPDIIESVVIAYSKYTLDNKQQASTPKEQINLLLKTINKSNNHHIENNKPALFNLLKTFTTATPDAL